MKPTSRYLEQPSMNGRPAEYAMIVEGDGQIAESEWFGKKEDAKADMVKFLKAAQKLLGE